jgi:hypothetical protein
VFIPDMVKTLDGLLVKNTLALSSFGVDEDGCVFLTSTFPVYVIGVEFCQPLNELTDVLEKTEPKFSE